MKKPAKFPDVRPALFKKWAAKQYGSMVGLSHLKRQTQKAFFAGYAAGIAVEKSKTELRRKLK